MGTPISTVTISSFRSNYPEFTDPSMYPDSGITYYLNLAGLLLTERWRRLLDTGTELFIAHNLVLEAKAQAEAANGTPPGVTTGPVASKGVDKVSVSYDVAAGIDPVAGHWNNTIYGTRFWNLVQMVGAGPIQVGAQGGHLDPLSSQNAWPGPNCNPGWFGS